MVECVTLQIVMQELRRQIGPQGVDQIKEDVGQLLRIVSGTVFLVDQIRQDERRPGLADFLLVDHDRMGPVGDIALEDGRIDIAVVGDDEVDDLAAGLAVDGPDVVGYGVIIRFPGLGHDVADIDLRRLAGADGLDDIGYAEIGHDARIEAARSEDDGVGFPDGVDGRLDGPGVFRRRKDALDLAVGMGNLRFPFDDAAVGHFSIKAELFRRRRDDLAADAQDLAGRVHGFFDVAQDFDEGGDEQVAEAVARQVAGAAEAVGEELFHEPFLIGQGDQAVAQVPWGDDIQVLADAACRTAIVGDGDDSRQVIGLGLEAAQHDRQARAAADDDDLRPFGQLEVGKDQVAEVIRFAGHDDADHGADQAPRRPGHDDQPQEDDQDAHTGQDGIVIMARHFIEQAESPFFQRPQPLVVKGQDNAEAGAHHAQAEEKEPSLDVQARMQPFHKTHDSTSYASPSYPGASSSTSFFWISRCSMDTSTPLSLRCLYMASAIQTLRCIPPVQPTAMTSWLLPSRS